MDTLTLSAVLRQGRKAKRWTQREASRKSGYSLVCLNLSENGRLIPSIETLVKLFALYDVRMSKEEMLKLVMAARQAGTLTKTERDLLLAFRKRDPSAVMRILAQQIG